MIYFRILLLIVTFLATSSTYARSDENHLAERKKDFYKIKIEQDSYHFTTTYNSRVAKEEEKRQTQNLQVLGKKIANLVSFEFKRFSKYFEGRGSFDSAFELSFKKSGEFSAKRITDKRSTYDVFLEKAFNSIKNKKLLENSKFSDFKMIMTVRRDFGDEQIKRLNDYKPKALGHTKPIEEREETEASSQNHFNLGSFHERKK